MVDNAPINMMYADLDLKIQYMNPQAEQTLKRLEAHLPIKVDQMIGQSIDIFHKAPRTPAAAAGRPPQPAAHRDDQRRPRARSSCCVSAMLDQHGKYIGPMITWEVVTEKVEAKRREAETAADIRAVNQLLLALGRCRLDPRRRHRGPGHVREAFGWSYGSFWEVNPTDHALRFAQDSGSVSEEFRRVTRRGTVPRGRGAQRPGLADPRPGLRRPTWAR